MKRKLVIGLIAIFAVVVIGGVAVSQITRKLRTVNAARHRVEQVHHGITQLHINVLNTVRDTRITIREDHEVRTLIGDVEAIRVSIQELRDLVMLKSGAQEGCGLCHNRPELFVTNMNSALDRLDSSFADFTLMLSLIVTRGSGVEEGPILNELGLSLDEISVLVNELSQYIAPMIEHIEVEVARNIGGILRTHDLTIMLTVVFVLIGIVVMLPAVTRPVHKLIRGTEAIVRGNYEHRIEIPGKDEIALFAERFNHMAEVLATRERNLREKKQELEDLNDSLEQKVRDRTRAVQEKQEEINRRYMELESTNEELQASYVQLESTAAELEEAQTKLQENYDTLKAMNEELNRASEVKNKFLSIMSHELRTPLTVINGYLSLILEKNYGEPTPELKEILMVIKEQARNQLGLIEDLLDLTRIESGEFRLFRQPCDLRQLLDQMTGNFRPNIEEKDITVSIEVAEDLPPVFWDHQKILQVFQNLMDNALKFTPMGGWITLSAKSKSEFIEIRVSDNGIGIPQDQMKQVFERFYQVDSSSTRSYSGSGLGLSIVREIILAHKGKIFVESEEGKGTTFLLLLPPGEPDRPSQLGSREGDEPDVEPVREIKLRGNNEMIMVVDDDPSFLKMMDTVLSREGYRVCTSDKPLDTVEEAKACDADIILLDLMMPDVDGFEICRQLKRDVETRYIPVLVVSASGGREVSRRVYEVGAEDHLVKPFDQTDVLYRIHHLLEDRRHSRELKGSAYGEDSAADSQTTD